MESYIFKNAEKFANQFLFIHVHPEKLKFRTLSGKYTYHSLRQNMPAFVRTETVDSVKNFTESYFLTYTGTCWKLQHEYKFSNEEAIPSLKLKEFIFGFQFSCQVTDRYFPNKTDVFL